jgi:hypothetical protein
MKAALQYGKIDAVALLAEISDTLPLALEQCAVADLLKTAMQMQNSPIRAFCEKLPGTLELPAEHVAPLLLLAVEDRHYLAAHDLLRLPSAAALSTATVLQLLETAVEGQAGEQLVHSLLALPACESIDSDSAAALLKSSLHGAPDYKVLTALLQALPAAANVQPHKFADVLATAVVKSRRVDATNIADVDDDIEAVEQLVRSLAARSLDASQMFTVFMRAVQMDRGEHLETLSELPAAEQLSPEQVYDIMLQAMQHRKFGAMAVHDLCTHLNVAVQLQPQQVYAVAYAVARISREDEVAGAVSCSLLALEALARLPGMQKITAYNLSELVTECIRSVDDSDDEMTSLSSVVAALLSVPSAQQLGQQQTSRLLSDAIAAQLHSCADLLLQLPAAQKMGADDLYSVMSVFLQHISTVRNSGAQTQPWQGFSCCQVCGSAHTTTCLRTACVKSCNFQRSCSIRADTAVLRIGCV